MGGPGQVVALTPPPGGPFNPGPCQRPYSADLSGSHPKIPGFAGGNLPCLAEHRLSTVPKCIHGLLVVMRSAGSFLEGKTGVHHVGREFLEA